jgi:AraC-like DNA-binding protein
MAKDAMRRSDRILGELDQPSRVEDLAGRIAYSEPHFFRIAKRELGEPPMGARRRLLLERAAYRLVRTDQPITEVAFDASFRSLEGFSRAFKRAYGLTPSGYRKLRPDEYRIDRRERLHFAPPASPDSKPRQGVKMKVPELMTEHHTWQVGQYLAACAGLDDAKLDETMGCREPFPWHCPQPTLREMLGRASAYAAPWMHAINGTETDYHPQSLEAMRAALPVNRWGFLDILRAVEADDSYYLTFVDAVCDPPVVFSYGGVIAHVLTHTAYRRAAISQHLTNLGLEFEEAMDALAWRQRPAAT